jgi:hypothetical protein
MHRAMIRDHLAQCHEHVALGDRHIERQRQIFRNYSVMVATLRTPVLYWCNS